MDDYTGNIFTQGVLGVGPGQKASGVLERSLDQDWFKVTLNAGSTYTFELSNNLKLDFLGRGYFSEDAIITLRDSTGEKWLAQERETSPKIIFTPTESGTYFLSVQELFGATGSYSLTLSENSSSPIEAQSLPTAEYHTLSVIVDLFGQVLYLKDLKETITSTNHTVEYGGTIFNWSEVDSFVTTVTRDGEFTDEFSREIVEAYPSVNGISYSTAVALVGAAAIDEILLAVAGADGNYVG